MRTNGIMVLDSSGRLSQGEVDAGFEASILYLKHQYGEAMRFQHRGTDGSIQSMGSYVWAGVSGERFLITFDTINNKERYFSFLLPSMYHDIPIPESAATFFEVPRKRGNVPKRAGQTVH